MGDKGNVKKVSSQPIIQPKAPTGKSSAPVNTGDTFSATKPSSSGGGPPTAVAPPSVQERGKTIYEEHVERMRALSNKTDNLYGDANVFSIALQLAPKALKTKPLQKHMPPALRAAFSSSLFDGYVFRNDPKAHYEKYLPTSGMSQDELRALEQSIETFLKNLS